MKKHYKYAIAIVPLVVYLAMWFMSWKSNPKDWGDGGRVLYMIITAVIIWIVLGFSTLKDN